LPSYPKITSSRILVTGGAGFIGSNLCEDLLSHDNEVTCLDNFSTGRIENLAAFRDHAKFKLIMGDIRNPDDCKKATEGTDIVFHEAALGSVPRSIVDPVTTNDVNISGFLNMLVASRDAQVRRFVYAASSSTYGDSEILPKVEKNIGMPLSPYAVTKYVNELYAHVFALNYGLETIGLRYFNVYGPKQDPRGAYAAVIPKFTMKLMAHESPEIFGDGTNSRDFTFVDNVVQMNHLAATTLSPEALNQVFNTAVGERNDLNQLTAILKKYLAFYDPAISGVPIIHSANRKGDIPHSHASIEKAVMILGYNPGFDLEKGLKIAVEWYWKNLGTPQP
jgi:UDP-N-acetylglucosamine 4-epimerase